MSAYQGDTGRPTNRHLGKSFSVKVQLSGLDIFGPSIQFFVAEGAISKRFIFKSINYIYSINIKASQIRKGNRISIHSIIIHPNSQCQKKASQRLGQVGQPVDSHRPGTGGNFHKRGSFIGEISQERIFHRGKFHKRGSFKGNFHKRGSFIGESFRRGMLHIRNFTRGCFIGETS